MLVGCRVMQAVAGALLMPNVVALVRETIPAARLGSTMGVLGAAFALGASAGPPLGSVLLGVGGWRWIFLVNLPLAAGAVALGVRALPKSLRERRAVAPFDRAGAVLLCATLVAAAWSLNGAGLSSGAAAALGAVALLVALVRLELRRPDPVLQPRLFARGAFGAAAAGVALSNLAMYVTVLALPVLLARRGGFGDTTAGLLLAAMSVASLVVTPVGGRLVDRAGSRGPAGAGLAMLAAALVPLALAPAGLPVAALAGCLVAAGAGLGLASAALQVAAVAAVDAGAARVAAGVFSTSRYAGSIAGDRAPGRAARTRRVRHERLRRAVATREAEDVAASPLHGPGRPYGRPAGLAPAARVTTSPIA
jgi:MFS family permease